MGDKNNSGTGGGEYQRLPQNREPVKYTPLPNVKPSNEYQQVSQQGADVSNNGPIEYERLPYRDNYTTREIQDVLNKEKKEKDPAKIIRHILKTNNRQQFARLLTALRNNGTSKERINLVRNARIPGVKFITVLEATDSVQKNRENSVLYPKDKKGLLSVCYKDQFGNVQHQDVEYKPKRGILRKKQAEYRITIRGQQHSFSSTEKLFEYVSGNASPGPQVFPDPPTNMPPNPAMRTSSTTSLPPLYTTDLTNGSGTQSGLQAPIGPQLPQLQRQQARPLTFSGGAGGQKSGATLPPFSLNDRAYIDQNVRKINELAVRAEFSKRVKQGEVPEPVISLHEDQLTITYASKDKNTQQSRVKWDKETGNYQVGERSFASLQEVKTSFEREALNNTRTFGPIGPPPRPNQP